MVSSGWTPSISASKYTAGSGEAPLRNPAKRSAFTCLLNAVPAVPMLLVHVHGGWAMVHTSFLVCTNSGWDIDKDYWAWKAISWMEFSNPISNVGYDFYIAVVGVGA